MPTSKPTHPGLFRPGMTHIDEKDIEKLFVDDFGTPKRRRLASQLRLFIAKLRSLGVRGEMWVNGSFATRNPNPNDIDIVIWISLIVLSALNDEQLGELSYLTGEEGRQVTREKYACDVYVAAPSDFNLRQYWTERFSSNPDSENQKGIAVITI